MKVLIFGAVICCAIFAGKLSASPILTCTTGEANIVNLGPQNYIVKVYKLDEFYYKCSASCRYVDANNNVFKTLECSGIVVPARIAEHNGTKDFFCLVPSDHIGQFTGPSYPPKVPSPIYRCDKVDAPL